MEKCNSSGYNPQYSSNSGFSSPPDEKNHLSKRIFNQGLVLVLVLLSVRASSLFPFFRMNISSMFLILRSPRPCLYETYTFPILVNCSRAAWLPIRFLNRLWFSPTLSATCLLWSEPNQTYHLAMTVFHCMIVWCLQRHVTDFHQIWQAPT